MAYGDSHYTTVTIKNFNHEKLWMYQGKDTFVQSVGALRSLYESLQEVERLCLSQQRRILELEEKIKIQGR